MREFIVSEDFHPEVKGYPELVRCKDCKYCEPFEGDALIWCNIHVFGRKPDYYCADGERKVGEQNEHSD